MAKDWNDEDWPKIEGQELCMSTDAEREVTLLTPNGYKRGWLSRFTRQGKVYVRFTQQARGEYIIDHSQLRWGWID